MGYFNGLVSGLFKLDKAGRVVFYPWGVLGKGYIITEKPVADGILRFVIIIIIVGVSGVAVAYMIKCKAFNS